MFNTKKYVRRASPELKKVAGKNNELYAGLLKLSNETFSDMGNIYEKGKLHKQSGAAMMEIDEFLFYFNLVDLDLPQEIAISFVDLLWRAYEDGYNGVVKR